MSTEPVEVAKQVVPIATFLWGFGGSTAVEIVTASQFFYEESIKVPERYKRISFYFVRFSLAIVGGGLALAYNITNPILAINIGAATPLIIQTFWKNPPPQVHAKATSHNHDTQALQAKGEPA